MEIPPGIAHLARFFLLPTGLAFSGLYFLHGSLQLPYPAWLDLFASPFLLIFVFVIKVKLKEGYTKAKAASLGALLPPRVRLGSLGIIKTIKTSFREEYVGMCCTCSCLLAVPHESTTGDCYANWSKQLGNTFEFNVFGDKQVGLSSRLRILHQIRISLVV
jgi:hypothetical protein